MRASLPAQRKDFVLRIFWAFVLVAIRAISMTYGTFKISAKSAVLGMFFCVLEMRVKNTLSTSAKTPNPLTFQSHICRTNSSQKFLPIFQGISVCRNGRHVHDDEPVRAEHGGCRLGRHGLEPDIAPGRPGWLTSRIDTFHRTLIDLFCFLFYPILISLDPFCGV